MWLWILAFVVSVLLILKLKHMEGPWEYSGKVVHGHGMARHVDWRTANLAECPRNTQERGFYSCMTNYGKASLIRSERGTCEVHIHNFNDDIYGKELKIKDLKQEDIPFGLTYAK